MGIPTLKEPQNLLRPRGKVSDSVGNPQRRTGNPYIHNRGKGSSSSTSSMVLWEHQSPICASLSRSLSG